MGTITLHKGDITTDSGADAIVNAATGEALEAHPQVQEARFWLFGDKAFDAFSGALDERT